MQVLLLVSAYVCVSLYSVSAQDVTLWQFAVDHLLDGKATLPLEPMGTAVDGQATTYLYQALNPTVSLESANGLTSGLTVLVPTPRTIVASASGWIELFGSSSPTLALGCSLIDSGVGNCFYGSPTALITEVTGTPTPIVLSVSTPSPSSSVTPSPSATPSSSQSITPSFPSSTVAVSSPTSPGSLNRVTQKQSSAGAIAGGVVGGLVGLTMISLAVVLFRRRLLLRQKQLLESEAQVRATPYTNQKTESSFPTTTFKNHIRPPIFPTSETDATLRQERSTQPPRSNHVIDSQSSMSQYMADLSGLLRRMEVADNLHEEPPPTYYAEN